jgi:hypothetical protein
MWVQVRAKARGFLSSLRGFPASLRLAWLGFLHRTRSYGLSTGSNREPRGQNVLCGSDVAVMDNPTFGARPRSYLQGEGVENMTTVKAAFGGRIPLVNLDQGSSIPGGFVLQLSDNVRPTHVTESFCQAVVVDQMLDLPTLDAYDLVFAYDANRELVLVVSSPICNLCMDASNREPSFVALLRAFSLLSMPPLCFCQAFLLLGEEFGIAVGVPICARVMARVSQVKALLA